MNEEQISEEQVVQALGKLKEVRSWAAQVNINPWALRQALLILLQMDTQVAIGSGVEPVVIANFDSVVRADADKFIRTLGRHDST